MTNRKTAVIVLAAGMGTRMKSARPKVMHPLAGQPMIARLTATIAGLKPEKTVVVIAPGMDEAVKAVAPHLTVVQKQRLGTGHAVKTALTALGNFTGDVLILYGDTPLLSASAMKKLIAKRRSRHDPAAVLLGFRPDDPGAYGRIIAGADGVEAIIEAGDASPEQAKINLCNSGAMAVDGKRLAGLVNKIGKDNAKGEYYLTAIIALARAQGWRCGMVELKGDGAEDELVGVNSRAELAQAEAILQRNLRDAAMTGGATLIDPKTVYFSYDTRIGRDVTIGPNVFFGPGVTIGDNVEIRSFCHIEGATVGNGAVVGPFARLRPGARIAGNAHIGNFVEIKNAVIESGAKVNHLSYIGDARVGESANVGAGTITCNYDGFSKHHTDIGAGAFIGSNTALVAPVKVGDGAVIGAGSVIVRDVAADSLALTRAEQKNIKDGAGNYRRQKTSKKMKKG
ncbi:MAG: UDP-N-acetylglucosamine diphosphorylase/glucosamine-1-phosphate N-acetyltransferase [Rhodospirillales bacterium RIFCSPLOWO2_12_FULL_58_28]|nr:MAG: UDP-N-acetylglucosamine diphosphorylase/glucosamine-1-phosphate N-acetyltransferase [Rhodospirillales bacterium RIFCSPLOWO2_02_FULL_58_16]OHC77753.1 MAG: UDP-N-acetylglucosamine diphosphorylase/glucosamine-1-phosphate N-acetyltransferase [Rhodospirillales bacterium RIFCSPLOWO2_12_FULL_58_28]